MPPEFSQSSYWDARFHKDPSAFEWLVPPDFFDGPVTDALAQTFSQSPQVFHIGCGTSRLSLRLRDLVESPHQVTNADFSRTAIDIGQNMEEGECGMQWEVVDLLDGEQIAALKRYGRHGGKFDVVVDKGAIDSVVSSENVPVDSVYVEWLCDPDKIPLLSPTSTRCVLNHKEGPHTAVSPECLVAIHLALLTTIGATWICVSYSSDRFGFLDQDLFGDGKRDNAHMPFILNKFWRLEQKQEIETAEVGGADEGSTVHRPKIHYWLYTLKRT